jgi:hypothetical protein
LTGGTAKVGLHTSKALIKEGFFMAPSHANTNGVAIEEEKNWILW